MLGGQDSYLYSHDSVYGATCKALPPALAVRLLPMISATNRFYARASGDYEPRPIQWDDGEPWRFAIEVRQDERDQWNITGSLRRGEDAHGAERAAAASRKRLPARARSRRPLRLRGRIRLDPKLRR